MTTTTTVSPDGTVVTVTTPATSSPCLGCIFGRPTCAEQMRHVGMWCAFCLRQRLYPDFRHENMCPRLSPVCDAGVANGAACIAPRPLHRPVRVQSSSAAVCVVPSTHRPHWGEEPQVFYDWEH